MRCSSSACTPKNRNPLWETWKFAQNAPAQTSTQKNDICYQMVFSLNCSCSPLKTVGTTPYKYRIVDTDRYQQDLLPNSQSIPVENHKVAVIKSPNYHFICGFRRSHRLTLNDTEPPYWHWPHERSQLLGAWRLVDRGNFSLCESSPELPVIVSFSFTSFTLFVYTFKKCLLEPRLLVSSKLTIPFLLGLVWDMNVSLGDSSVHCCWSLILLLTAYSTGNRLPPSPIPIPSDVDPLDNEVELRFKPSFVFFVGVVVGGLFWNSEILWWIFCSKTNSGSPGP